MIVVPTDGRPVFTMRLTVRRYEIDALGHVNNAVYLNYLEQAATQHADALGFGRARLRELGGHFVVRRHEVDYLGAAVEGDDLDVTTWPELLIGARAIRDYEIRHASTGTRLVAARTVWAWIDARSGAPRPLPREILASFSIPKPNTRDRE